MKNPKTFIAYHHRYRIVYTTDTASKARAAIPLYRRGTERYSDSILLRKLPNGRWAVGVRRSG